MDSEFWLDVWRRREIRFHQANYHPFLNAYFKGLPAGRVLVPLCGKSLDLNWLCEQGHQVTGVELSETACREFFEERGEVPQITAEQGFKVFRTSQIELWCGDFFQFALTGFDYYYDRAALVALPPAMRKKYVEHLTGLLTGKMPARFEALIITFEYPQERAEGPPFAVLRSEVETLFGPHFEVTLHTRVPSPELSRSPRFVGINDVAESAYRLRRKA